MAESYISRIDIDNVTYLIKDSQARADVATLQTKVDDMKMITYQSAEPNEDELKNGMVWIG